MIDVNKPKIPENATNVFTGLRWKVWQWPQIMPDGSVETYEMLERSDAVTGLAISKGKIALLEQTQVPNPHPFVCFPGGEVDPGESLEEALKRELLEEAGCVAGSIMYWRVSYPPDRIAAGYYYYIVRDCTVVGPPNPDLAEHITVRWITFDELFTIALTKEFRHKDLVADFLLMDRDPKKKEEFRTLLGL